MKKIVLALAIIASVFAFSSCGGKDDEPEQVKGGKVSGNCKVDGKKFDVKYGYLVIEDGDKDVVFFDKDVSKYIDDLEDEAPDFDLCSVDIYFKTSGGKQYPQYVDLGYKINYRRETGTVYEFEGRGLDEFVSMSLDGNKAECKTTKTLPVTKYDWSTDDELGTAEATFNISGKVTTMNYDDVVYYDTRSFELSEDAVITVLTDPMQIQRLKALKPIKR